MFIRTIIIFIAQSVLRWFIGQFVFISILYGLSLFVEEIRKFISGLFESFNNYIAGLLDRILNTIWILLVRFQEKIISYIAVFENKINNSLDIDIDDIFIWVEIGASIDKYTQHLINKLIAGLTFYLNAVLNPIKEKLDLLKKSVEYKLKAIISLIDVYLQSIKTIIENIKNKILNIKKIFENITIITDKINHIIDELLNIQITINNQITIILQKLTKILITDAKDIANYSAKQLIIGQTITQADIINHQKNVESYAKTQLLTLFTKIDFHFKFDFIDDIATNLKNISNELLQIQINLINSIDVISGLVESVESAIIDTLKDIKNTIYANFSGFIINIENIKISLIFLIKEIQDWITNTFLNILKTGLEEFAREFFLIAWALKFNEFREDIAQDFINKKEDIKIYVSEKKEEIRDYINSIKENINVKEEALMQLITREKMQKIYENSLNNIFDHTVEIEKNLEQVDISDFIKNVGDVDYIIANFQNRTHNKLPNKNYTKELNLDDIHRFITDYFDRTQRVALAIIIAENDLTYDAKEFYDKLWEKKEN